MVISVLKSRLFFFLYKAIMFMMLRLSYATKKWMFCIIFYVVHVYVYQRLTKVCFHAFLVYYCQSVYNRILLGFDKRLNHYVLLSDSIQLYANIIYKYSIHLHQNQAQCLILPGLLLHTFNIQHHLSSSSVTVLFHLLFSSNIYLFCLTCKLIYNSRNKFGLYLLWWQLA